MSPRPAILIVEPDHDTRDGFREFLELSGERVVEASSELEALHSLRVDGFPAVILLDAPLAGLGDNPLLRMLEDVPALNAVPVVLLTSPPGPRFRLAPEGLRNVRRILIKPIELDVLLEALREVAVRPGEGVPAGVT